MEKFNRDCYIKQNQPQWKIEGNEFTKKRENLGVPRAEIARLTSFSSATIAKLENGDPIKNRKYLIASYQIALKCIVQRLRIKIDSIDSLSL